MSKRRQRKIEKATSDLNEALIDLELATNDEWGHRWTLLAAFMVARSEVEVYYSHEGIFQLRDHRLVNPPFATCQVCEVVWEDGNSDGAQNLPCAGSPEMSRARVDLELAARAVEDINDEGGDESQRDR